jgi:hypothetical protein
MRSDLNGVPPPRVNQQLSSSFIAGVVCQIFGVKCQKAESSRWLSLVVTNKEHDPRAANQLGEIAI